jgi:hypothetical protein
MLLHWSNDKSHNYICINLMYILFVLFAVISFRRLQHAQCCKAKVSATDKRNILLCLSYNLCVFHIA